MCCVSRVERDWHAAPLALRQYRRDVVKKLHRSGNHPHFLTPQGKFRTISRSLERFDQEAEAMGAGPKVAHGQNFHLQKRKRGYEVMNQRADCRIEEFPT